VVTAAFADLHYDIHHVIADGDLVPVNSTMNGHHVEPIVLYTDDGQVDTAFPPTRKTTSGRPSSSAGYRRRPPT
jgi:hypothetical protein